MPNACYRCKSSIPSGQSFCETCREDHGADLHSDGLPAGPQRWLAAVMPGESRAWPAAVLSGAVAIAAIYGWVYLPLPGWLFPIGVLAAMFAAFTIHLDAAYVRQYDADWTPWVTGYKVLVFGIFLTGGLLMVLAAPYHVFRRKRADGVPT